MNNSWRSVNLSLEFHVVSTFWLEYDTSGTFSLYFAQPRGQHSQPWRPILWWRTDSCSCKFSVKVSLMLENPFPVPFLCKLNHISSYFIQINTKITCKLLIPFRESHVFLKRSPVFWAAQHNIKISIKTGRVSILSFRFLWLWSDGVKHGNQSYLVADERASTLLLQN